MRLPDRLSLTTLLGIVAVLAFGYPALHGWFVDSGRCVPGWAHHDECYLLDDDRWDALVATVIAVGALLTAHRVGAGALVDEEDRARVKRALLFLAVIALATALFVVS